MWPGNVCCCYCLWFTKTMFSMSIFSNYKNNIWCEMFYWLYSNQAKYWRGHEVDQVKKIRSGKIIIILLEGIYKSFQRLKMYKPKNNSQYCITVSIEWLIKYCMPVMGQRLSAINKKHQPNWNHPFSFRWNIFFTKKQKKLSKLNRKIHQ